MGDRECRALVRAFEASGSYEDLLAADAALRRRGRYEEADRLHPRRAAAMQARRTACYQTGTIYEVQVGEHLYQVRLDAVQERRTRICVWGAPKPAWDAPPPGDGPESAKARRRYRREEIRIQREVAAGALEALGIELAGRTPSERLPWDPNAGCSFCPCIPGFTRPAVEVARDRTESGEPISRLIVVDIFIQRVRPCWRCGFPVGIGACERCTAEMAQQRMEALMAIAAAAGLTPGDVPHITIHTFKALRIRGLVLADRDDDTVETRYHLSHRGEEVVAGLTETTSR